MTTKSALMGIPIISYNAIPNIIKNFLVRKQLMKRKADPKRISS
ncbi:MAG: hypothetical protein ACPGQP_00210 [Nitrosopumilus sp.]